MEFAVGIAMGLGTESCRGICDGVGRGVCEGIRRGMCDGVGL